MIAVCDMGPLHYLVLIGAEHVLPQLFDRVVTARVVIDKEMNAPGTPEPVRAWAASPPHWLEVKEPTVIEDIPSDGSEPGGCVGPPPSWDVDGGCFSTLLTVRPLLDTYAPASYPLDGT